MNNLISSKEAKLAWANGECVEFRNQKDKWYEGWTNIYDAKNGFSIQEFDDSNYEFRIKPKTIILNGVEIPAPFKPKVGDTYWFLTTNYENGYDYLKNSTGEYDSRLAQFGAWDSEDKIKEVVRAVRNVFNCGDNQC